MNDAFIMRAVDLLQLKLPVEIRLNYKPNAENCGEYQPRFNSRGDVKLHVVWIYMRSLDRGFETTVVHELIHAWQAENDIADIHGKSFRRIAKMFPEYPDVYLPKVDKP